MLRKNCVIYVRVSTEEQTKGYSLNGQERIDRDFAASQGYEVINVFREEGISAKDLNRPQLQAMMNWVREHAAEVDAVIFWKWERISRGTEYDYAVLGKRRRPVTGDSVESLIWVLMMTMACGSMITSVVMLTAGKSPNKK